MTQQYIVEPKKGLGLKLKKGQILKVVDVEGQQVLILLRTMPRIFMSTLIREQRLMPIIPFM